MSVLETLEKAKDLGRRIKRAKNDTLWMEHCLSVREKTLESKRKQLAELSKEVPELEKETSDRRAHLTKITAFLAKHEGSIDDVNEIEAVTAKMEKLVREIAALKDKLNEKIADHATRGNNQNT
jgi:chromosome segregation ATPase